jgi:preprotein translocase subunit SecY
MTALTAAPMVFAGFLQPSGDVALRLGISQTALAWIMFAQIFVGGMMILYMDEIISKWGVGSGIGLFIIAGVSQRLIGGFLSWGGVGQEGYIGFFPQWYGILTGAIEIGSPLTMSGLSDLFLDQGRLLALVTTFLIFVVVVYAESVRVEIPLSHSRVKGARGRFPVKLIYASVLPMILVRALQANIQFLGRILYKQSPQGESAIVLFGERLQWLGQYNKPGGGAAQPIDGLFYYLAPIYRRRDWMWWLGGTSAEPWQIMIRVGVDLTFMVIGGAIFAIFWVETTGMGPKATAKQIQNSGMQIPGFRQSPGVTEKVLERYIPQVTVIGGALVGLLAVMANMLGTIGQVTGTGLLLTVSITYKLYEEIAEEQLMEMHPMMRQMFG